MPKPERTMSYRASGSLQRITPATSTACRPCSDSNSQRFGRSAPEYSRQAWLARSLGESGLPIRLTYSGVATRHCSAMPMGRAMSVLDANAPMRIPSSMPSPIRSTSPSVRVMSNCTCGCSSRNRPSSGAILRLPYELGMASRSMPVAAAVRSLEARRSSTASSSWRTCSYSRRASGVGVSRRVVLANSWTPRALSKDAICLLIDDWEVPSSLATAEKLPDSQQRTKAAYVWIASINHSTFE